MVYCLLSIVIRNLAGNIDECKNTSDLRLKDSSKQDKMGINSLSFKDFKIFWCAKIQVCKSICSTTSLADLSLPLGINATVLTHCECAFSSLTLTDLVGHEEPKTGQPPGNSSSSGGLVITLVRYLREVCDLDSPSEILAGQNTLLFPPSPLFSVMQQPNLKGKLFGRITRLRVKPINQPTT